MIVVSPLDRAEEAFRQYKPAYVVSILDSDEPTPPLFDSLSADNHIKLISNCARIDDEGCDGGSLRCDKILELAKRWAQDGKNAPILIHCNEGAARSMAVAYILMCAVDTDCSEKDAAARLRAAAPHADPNLLLISEADAAMNRNDRMIEAILDLCPCSSTVGAPIVTLPLAA